MSSGEKRRDKIYDGHRAEPSARGVAVRMPVTAPLTPRCPLADSLRSELRNKAHSPSNATLKTFSRARGRNGESENDIKLSRGARSLILTPKIVRSSLDTPEKHRTSAFGFSFLVLQVLLRS